MELLASQQAVEKPIKERGRISFEDPTWYIFRAIKKLNSLWLSWTYPFASVGRRLSVHYSCDLRRSIASYISIGDDVLLDQNVRVDVVAEPNHRSPVILIDDGCNLGQRVTILAINKIHIERNNIFGPSVFVTDHNHSFEQVDVPIKDQGITAGGTIRIEEGCWIGFGAAVVCGSGELVIGRHSVISANSLVTRSIPPYSIVAGNPGRVVKQFDPVKGQWVIGGSGPAGRS